MSSSRNCAKRVVAARRSTSSPTKLFTLPPPFSCSSSPRFTMFRYHGSNARAGPASTDPSQSERPAGAGARPHAVRHQVAVHHGARRVAPVVELGRHRLHLEARGAERHGEVIEPV